MSESTTENMACPKCGKFQKRADVCNACGVIIAKVICQETNSQTQSGNTAPEKDHISNNIGRNKTSQLSSKQKLILPITIMGVILIGIGSTMLVNKLSGGSLNTGTMRHLSWFLIPVFIMTGIGCIGQAKEWKDQSNK